MIEYSIEGCPEASDVAKVFERSGIHRPYNDLDRITKMIEGANLIVCAREQGRLMGIARSTTDFCYCCYLSDLAVDSAFQGQGIGKRLIDETKQRIGPQVALILVSAPEAEAFYQRIGMESVSAFRLPREH